MYVREEGGLTDLPQCIYTREREGWKKTASYGRYHRHPRQTQVSLFPSVLPSSLCSALLCVCVCVCVCIMCMSILMWTVDSTVDSVGNKCTVDCRWWGLQFTVYSLQWDLNGLDCRPRGLQFTVYSGLWGINALTVDSGVYSETWVLNALHCKL